MGRKLLNKLFDFLVTPIWEWIKSHAITAAVLAIILLYMTVKHGPKAVNFFDQLFGTMEMVVEMKESMATKDDVQEVKEYVDTSNDEIKVYVDEGFKKTADDMKYFVRYHNELSNEVILEYINKETGMIMPVRDESYVPVMMEPSFGGIRGSGEKGLVLNSDTAIIKKNGSY
jgi:hypothetical protein